MAITFTIIALIVGIIGFIAGFSIAESKFTEEIKNKIMIIESLERQVIRLSNTLREIQDKLKYQQYLYKYNSQDILDAVKYAMKKSHPDNGGTAEIQRFIQ